MAKHFQYLNHNHNSSNQSNFHNYQHNFPIQAPQPSFQGLPADKKSTELEKILASFMQNTGQAISRLERQMSQLANSINERPKGTLSSQSVTNPRNSIEAHMPEEDPMNQYNFVHTLRSGKKLIIKCLYHPIPFSTTIHKHHFI